MEYCSMKVQIVILIVFCSYIESLRPPNYLKPCTTKSSNYKKCTLRSANLALPSILRGDKQFKIPSLNPLKLPRVHIDSPNLNIHFNNVIINGIPDVYIKDIDIDKNHASISVYIKKIEILSPYIINGRILILPIHGTGKSNITAVGGNYHYTCTFKHFQRENKFYASNINGKIDYNFERVYFNFENLFNGDQQLSTDMNKFLNENWEDVLKDLGGAIKGAILGVVEVTIKNLFENIPLNELFLDS